MRNLPKQIVEKIKTYFVFNNFFPENRAVYEVMWKNMVQPDRSQMTVQYGVMLFVCWVTGAIDTQSKSLVLSTYCFSLASIPRQ